MKKMEFKVRCVRECLLRYGHVYTVRSYYAWSDLEGDVVQVDGIGSAVRRYLIEIKQKQDLSVFLPKSGFRSVDDWWNAIEYWCKNRRKWLYFVFLK